MFELSALVGAGFITEGLGGHAAALAAPVLRIQGLAVMGTFVAVACGFLLLSVRRDGAVLLANAAGFIVTFVVSLMLILIFSAQGAAIAPVAAEFALAGVSILALRRTDKKVKLRFDIIPIALLAGGLGVGAGLLVGINQLLDVAVGTCVYARAVGTRSVPTRDRSHAPGEAPLTPRRLSRMGATRQPFAPQATAR